MLSFTSVSDAVTYALFANTRRQIIAFIGIVLSVGNMLHIRPFCKNVKSNIWRFVFAKRAYVAYSVVEGARVNISARNFAAAPIHAIWITCSRKITYLFWFKIIFKKFVLETYFCLYLEILSWRQMCRYALFPKHGRACCITSYYRFRT